MSFPSAFQIASDIDMLTFTLLMQLGMTIAIAHHESFYIVRSPHIYHRYGDGGPHIYVDLGTGSPVLYSYGEGSPNLRRGPHIYHRYGDGGSPYLCRFGDGVPKSI